MDRVTIASAGSASVAANDQENRLQYDKEARESRLNKKRIGQYFVIVCSGFALISDGYQNNVMTMLNTVFAMLFPKEYTSSLKTSVSNASLVGTIFGQVVVGVLSDRLSRKKSIVLATAFLVFGTIMCAASHGASVTGMFWMMIIFRGVTGFGIGAEYPSCSVSANEAANEACKRRGRIFVLVTNLPLSFGGPFALIIFLIVYQITGLSNALWRTLFAIGAFWPLSVFYFRYKMATSELFKKSAIRKNVPYWLALKFYWTRLFGVCACWFLYDFVTFPNGIFAGTIISGVLKGTAKKNVERIAEWNLLLGVLGIPGVIIGAFLCDRIGRKYTLMTGFLGYIVFGLVIGITFDKVKNITVLFIFLYGFMMSLGNLGPGNMMGLTASESFATPIRGTFYGICAAIGKVGAVVGTRTFTHIQTHLGQKWTFIIAAICGLAGVLVAFFFVPHLNDSDLMEEDVKFINYLRENGWNHSFGTEEGVSGSPNYSEDEEISTGEVIHHTGKTD